MITHFENICKSDLPCISFKPLYKGHLGLTEESGRCREVAVSGSLTVVEKSIECEKNVLTIDSFLFPLTIAERCRDIDEQFKLLEKGSSQSKKQSGPVYLLFKIVAELNRIIP